MIAGEWLQQALMVLFVYLMVVKPGDRDVLVGVGDDAHVISE